MPKDLSAAWKTRHQRWLRFVQANVKAMDSGKAIRLGPSAKPLAAPVVKASKGPPLKVVVCSPHPDDEALVGALPLRLAGNVARGSPIAPSPWEAILASAPAVCAN